MPRPESWTAKFFKSLPSQSDNIPRLKCTLCGKIFQAARQSLSNRNRHMQTAHLDIVRSHQATSQAQPGSSQERAGTGAINQYFPKPSVGQAKNEEITQALISFVASSYLPLRVVETEGFKKFTKVLNPGYQVPCRKALRAQIIRAAAEKQNDLKKELCGLPDNRTVTITMDLWSSRSLLSYMGMTVHFVADDTLRSELLAFRRFTRRHTGENIKNMYQDVVAEFHLERKVLLLVTDGASNMLKAFRPSFYLDVAAADDMEPEQELNEVDELGDQDEAEPVADEARMPIVLEELEDLVPERVSCAAHSLQLVVKDGLREAGQGAISKALTRLNAFVGRSKKLSHAAELLNRAKKTLQKANVTRWNSQLRTIESFLNLPDDVLAELKCLPALEGLCPSTSERMLLKEVATIFQPFLAATDVLQGDKVVTSSHVVPTVRGLCSSLVALRTVSKAADRLREALLKHLDRRFIHVESNPFFVTATVLDPRFKLLPWSNATEAGSEIEVQSDCLRHMHKQLSSRPAPRPAPSPAAATAPAPPAAASEEPEVVTLDDADDPSPPPPPPTPTVPGPSRAGLYSYMKKTDVVKTATRMSLELELTKYLSEDVLHDEANPLHYWASAKERYPQLYATALNHLSVTASSAPSERIFSVSGNLITPSRSRLDQDVIQALMHLKC